MSQSRKIHKQLAVKTALGTILFGPSRLSLVEAIKTGTERGPTEVNLKSLCSTAPRAGHDKRSKGRPEAVGGGGIVDYCGIQGSRYSIWMGIGNNKSTTTRRQCEFPTFKLSIAGLVIIEAKAEESGFDATSRLI